MHLSNHIYIVAEAGVNHNGSLDMARQLVDAAVEAGADSVKFQTFHADNFISKSTAKAKYQFDVANAQESQYEMIKRLELSEDAHFALYDYCKQKSIDFLSSPFDYESLIFLTRDLNLPVIKIPSGEITNAPFLLQIAQTGKPVFLSTGMSTLGEVETALSVLAFGYISPNGTPSIDAFNHAYINKVGQEKLQAKVVLLHCTTEYPVPYDDVNLRAMDTLRQAFNLPVGFSDHTENITVAIAAAARGAAIIEKHFTLDKTLPGPDHKASLTPDELRQMIGGIRQVEVVLGSSIKAPSPSELNNIIVARKSLVAAKAINKGEVFSQVNITAKRPATGLSPLHYWDLLGKTAVKRFEPDELIVDKF